MQRATASEASIRKAHSLSGLWLGIGSDHTDRKIVNTQKALKEDPNRATSIGKKLFPPQEAALIAELIRRDLPHYDATISEEFVVGMNQFARDVGVLRGHPSYTDVVATQFAPLWKA